MKSAIKTTITLFFLLIIVVSSAQDIVIRDGENKKDTIVSLLQKIDDPVSVVLFRNDNYVISSSFTLLRSNLTDWISRNPDVPGDAKLLELIDKTAKTSQVIDVANIAEMNKLGQRLNLRIATLLQQGNCMIYDKKKYNSVARITVQTYEYHCGELCGDGGRRFYINNILIFHVVDWMN